MSDKAQIERRTDERETGYMGEYIEGDRTLDGSVDRRGRPAIRAKTGSWFAGILLLVNQGLCTLAYFGILVNLVLFLTRVMGKSNARAAYDVGMWTGTVYLFSIVGAFLSDSYWGRYKTCAVFQAIFVVGLVSLSLLSYFSLVKPDGCGRDEQTPCGSHSTIQVSLFYLIIYVIALGNGAYQPNVATFGADQFDEEHPKESRSKVAFFSYFYLALNLGMLGSNTVLGYFENEGRWALGFWASAGAGILGLMLFLVGTPRYRHFIPKENPWKRFFQVVVAAFRKWNVKVPLNGGDLFEVQEVEGDDSWAINIRHSRGLNFLDKAAMITPKDYTTTTGEKRHNPWRLCPVTQIEEVKAILRLLPIWLCTIMYSLVYTQMSSLFVEQGAVMEKNLAGFQIPPGGMSAFEVLSCAAFIFVHRHSVDPLVARLRKSGLGLTEVERMGVGLVVAFMSMVAAGVVELYRIREADFVKESSNLSIFTQVPQYVLLGISEVYMLIGQLEFFNGQAPHRLRSFGSALSMTSMSLGNYSLSLILTLVTKFSTLGGSEGWIPRDLNKGHLDRFFFLLAALTAVDLAIYIVCAKSYQYTSFEQRSSTGKKHEGK